MIREHQDRLHDAISKLGIKQSVTLLRILYGSPMPSGRVSLFLFNGTAKEKHWLTLLSLMGLVADDRPTAAWQRISEATGQERAHRIAECVDNIYMTRAGKLPPRLMSDIGGVAVARWLIKNQRISRTSATLLSRFYRRVIAFERQPFGINVVQRIYMKNSDETVI